MEKVNENEKICCNCKHVLGIGGDLSFGLRCKHPENQKEEILPIIPSQKHSCRFFESKFFLEE